MRNLLLPLAGVITLACLLGSACQHNHVPPRERGHDAYRAGDYRTAIAEYETAISYQPTDVHSQYYLAQSYLETGKPLRAETHFERALTLERDDDYWTPMIIDGLAEALYQQDRVAELHASLDEWVQRYGTTTDRLRQVEYLRKTGDPDGAKLALRKAAAFADPGDASPYIALADFYHDINDYDNELKALRWAAYVDADHRGLPDRFRRLGYVPGPTLAEAPPKPEMIR